jgi:hypothetical protein
MDPTKITDASFVHQDGERCPTFDLPLSENLLRYTALRIQKLDEDPDHGYCYGILLMPQMVQVGVGWFDGFGCLDRPNDVIHFVRAFVRAFCPK